MLDEKSENKSSKPAISDEPLSDDIQSPNTEAILTELLNPEGGLYTSLGENFNNTTFGRDSLISARELLEWDPGIAHDVILNLAKMQGTKNRKISNEEPGRIIHEHRDFRTWEASFPKKTTFKAISHIWGGNSEQMTTYFSIDSTPLFTMLVADYAKENPEILNEKVVRNDGQEITIRQSMINSAEWVSNHIAKSGLVEVGRHNPTSLIHQTWKDSTTSYIKDDGTMANVLKPIAYLEIQTLAANSLSSAAELIADDRPDQARRWRSTSESIINNTVKKFWMEDKQFFASAIDKDEYGNEHQLHTLQSDAGRILNSSFFDKMPENDRAKYVTAVVKELFSQDFLTDVGIRCRSLNTLDKDGLADYHGSLVSWPIDTYMTAKGLRKQGLPRLAEQLESRIINAVNISGNHYEFFYVMPDGKVIFSPKQAQTEIPGAQSLPVQTLPESNIAWTVAATYMIKSHDNQTNIPTAEGWHSQLESEILGDIKDVQTIKTNNELIAPEQPNVWLDIKKGSEISTKRVVKELSRLAIKNFFHGHENK